MDQSKPRAIIKRTVMTGKQKEHVLDSEWTLLSGSDDDVIYIEVLEGTVRYSNDRIPGMAEGIRVFKGAIVAIKGPACLKAEGESARFAICENEVNITLV